MPRMFADDTNISYAAADSVNELQSNVLNSELIGAAIIFVRSKTK